MREGITEIAKYVATRTPVLAVGIWLFRKASAYAAQARGYEAMGGEVLVIPFVLVLFELGRYAAQTARYREEENDVL